MTINFNSKELDEILKYLEGGAMPEEAAQAPEQAGGSPEEQIIQACQQAVETQDCNLAIQVCQAVLQMMGGGAPAPQEAPGEPVYKAGGVLKYWKK